MIHNRKPFDRTLREQESAEGACDTSYHDYIKQWEDRPRSDAKVMDIEGWVPQLGADGALDALISMACVHLAKLVSTEIVGGPDERTETAFKIIERFAKR